MSGEIVELECVGTGLVVTVGPDDAKILLESGYYKRKEQPKKKAVSDGDSR